MTEAIGKGHPARLRGTGRSRVSSWMVILESRDTETGEGHRDVFELTPSPEPGRERQVLAELVGGIHPGAVERSYDGTTAVFDEGPREITASFAAEGAGAPRDERPPDAQGTLFG